MNSITVSVNSKQITAVATTNLDNLVRQLDLSGVGYVAAINNTVIPRSEWSNTVLNDGDSVSLFQAIAGG